MTSRSIRKLPRLRLGGMERNLFATHAGQILEQLVKSIQSWFLYSLLSNFTTNRLPDTFCWTKMGTEAGQVLESIIARKNAERALGNGMFFWGICTALGQKIWEFIDSHDQPFVLFSPMKSKPNKDDVCPEKIFLWTSYIDRCGNKNSIPSHFIVTSRGTSHSINKKQHYAFVCYNDNSLKQEKWPSIDWAKLKNYKRNSKLGCSQVTAIVEHNKNIESSKLKYDVLFSAKLVEPYYVILSDPFELPSDLISIINSFSSTDCYEAATLYNNIVYLLKLFVQIKKEKNNNFSLSKKQ